MQAGVDVIVGAGKMEPMNLAEGVATFMGMDLPTWLGAVAVVLAIVIPLWIYIRQKSPKTLDYSIIDSQDLTPPSNEDDFPRLVVNWMTMKRIMPPSLDDDVIEVTENHYLERPRISKVRVENTGKRALLTADFQDPIKVSVTDGEIIDISVVETSHSGIHELGSLPESVTSFVPRLMNPGDWVTLRIITDECSKDPHLDTWIVEQSRGMRKRDNLAGPSVWSAAKERMKTLGGTEGPWAVASAVSAVLGLAVAAAAVIISFLAR